MPRSHIQGLVSVLGLKSNFWASLITNVYLNYSLIKSLNWIGLCSVLRHRQHSIGYMGDGFYRSKDPTNSIKVLKEKAVKENNPKNKEKTNYTCIDTQKVDKYSIQV